MDALRDELKESKGSIQKVALNNNLELQF